MKFQWKYNQENFPNWVRIGISSYNQKITDWRGRWHWQQLKHPAELWEVKVQISSSMIIQLCKHKWIYFKHRARNTWEKWATRLKFPLDFELGSSFPVPALLPSSLAKACSHLCNRLTCIPTEHRSVLPFTWEDRWIIIYFSHNYQLFYSAQMAV